jgi:hypothetical protein
MPRSAPTTHASGQVPVAEPSNPDEEFARLAMRRPSVDLGIGATIALFIWLTHGNPNPYDGGWGYKIFAVSLYLLTAAFFGMGGGMMAGAFTLAAIKGLKTAHWSPRRRLTGGLAVAAAAVAVIALVRSLPGFAAAVLPAAFVAACGL